MIYDKYNYNPTEYKKSTMKDAGIATGQYSLRGVLFFEKPMTMELREELDNLPCGYLLRQDNVDLCPVNNMSVSWNGFDSDYRSACDDAALLDLLQVLDNELNISGTVVFFDDFGYELAFTVFNGVLTLENPEYGVCNVPLKTAINECEKMFEKLEYKGNVFLYAKEKCNPIEDMKKHKDSREER